MKAGDMHAKNQKNNIRVSLRAYEGKSAIKCNGKENYNQCNNVDYENAFVPYKEHAFVGLPNGIWNEEIKMYSVKKYYPRDGGQEILFGNSISNPINWYVCDLPKSYTYFPECRTTVKLFFPLYARYSFNKAMHLNHHIELNRKIYVWNCWIYWI